MKNNIQKVSTFFSNGLIYGLNGIFTILPLYLIKYFTNVEMGYLLALPPLVLCIAPLFWGKVSDKAPSQNIVMILLVVGAVLAFCGMNFTHNFYLTALLLIIYAFFQSSFGSLIDIITIRSASELKVNYGFFRTNGTVLYAVMTLVVTLFYYVESAFVVYAVCGVFAIVFVFFMPKVTTVEFKAKKDEKRENLMKNKELWLLIIIIFPAYFAWGYFHNFFPTYITETLGLSKSIWGVVAFLTAFSEIPFFVYYNKIFGKFRIKHILAISMFALVLRFIAFAFIKDTAVLIFISFITGLFITVLIYCITKYIVSAIIPQYSNRAQSLAYAFGTGVSKMFAGIFGGHMTDAFGENTSFLICAIFIFIGFLLIFICKNTMDSIDEKIIAAKYKK